MNHIWDTVWFCAIKSLLKELKELAEQTQVNAHKHVMCQKNFALEGAFSVKNNTELERSGISILPTITVCQRLRFSIMYFHYIGFEQEEPARKWIEAAWKAFRVKDSFRTRKINTCGNLLQIMFLSARVLLTRLPEWPGTHQQAFHEKIWSKWRSYLDSQKEGFNGHLAWADLHNSKPGQNIQTQFWDFCSQRTFCSHWNRLQSSN